jgi:hypothetical protein
VNKEPIFCSYYIKESNSGGQLIKSAYLFYYSRLNENIIDACIDKMKSQGIVYFFITDTSRERKAIVDKMGFNYTRSYYYYTNLQLPLGDDVELVLT